MVVEFAIGLLGAVPFAGLLAIWNRRNPTWTASVGHITLAAIASIAAMIVAATAVDLEGSGFGLLLPIVAGSVVGMTAKQRGLILPDGSGRDGPR